MFAAGHSNGGQGCWYWASHYPDRFVAGTETWLARACDIGVQC